MTFELRPYQQAAVDSIFNYYYGGKKGNPIVVASTGSGKSLIIAGFIKKLQTEYKGQRVILATHVRELISQNYEKLVAIYPEGNIGIYSAGLSKRHIHNDIIYGSIQSMYRKAHKFSKRAFLIVDECQLLNPKDAGRYMSFITDLKKNNPHLKIIGLSATPWRLKGGSLLSQENAIFTDICYNIGIRELLNLGFLAPLVSKSSVVQADLSEVKITAGEYNAKQAEVALDKDALTHAAIGEVKKYAHDRKHFLWFCAGVDHSYHVRDALHSHGYSAEVVTGKTPGAERDRTFKLYREGRITHLINNMVLTTGTDLPMVDCIVLLRATVSSALFVQIMGRGMRIHPGKRDTLVLDFADNINKFGAVDLIEPPVPGMRGPKIVPQKICPECRQPALNMIRICPTCGYIFILPKEAHNSTASDGEILSKPITPERCDVRNVYYRKHVGKSGTPSMRVSYYGNMGLLTEEYICPEHTGWAKIRSNNWISLRGGNPLTETVDQAVLDSQNLQIPIAIHINPNSKYKEIIRYEFKENES